MNANIHLNLINSDVDSLSGPALVVFAHAADASGTNSKNSNQSLSIKKVSARSTSAKSASKSSGKVPAAAKATANITAKVSHSELHQILAESLSEKTITGKALESVSFREFGFGDYRHLVVVGLGKSTSLTHEVVRQATAGLLKELKALNVKEAVVQFDGVTTNKRDLESHLKALVEGLYLSAYSFDELKTTGKNSEKRSEKNDVLQIHIASKHGADASAKKAFAEGTHMASCVNFARRLGDMPGNLMTPTILANETVAAAKGTGLKVTVWDKARIKKERMGGLLGVAEGSAQEPRFIIMEYRGASKTEKPVVFVGKGLTFDTGGTSIKPSAGMEEMKYDMCGGANVIGTLLAIAKLKLKVNVIGLVPSTENMPGSKATKPGDVHYARNGKSFEVNNTDAEGRLILADALTYATELEPAVIYDAATLTGAMVMALGNIHTGFFTRNKPLGSEIEKAAEVSGELVWAMPLCDQHVKDMKGTFADLSNMSSGKGAGSATAAAFLEQFVGEGIPWAHFDIAGTGWAVGGRLPYCTPKGASGAILRTFVELARARE